MFLRVSTFILFFLAVLIFFFDKAVLSEVYGFLTETGICTDGKFIIGNETQILNQSAANYIKNLTSDNRLMAEMIFTSGPSDIILGYCFCLWK